MASDAENLKKYSFFTPCLVAWFSFAVLCFLLWLDQRSDPSRRVRHGVSAGFVGTLDERGRLAPLWRREGRCYPARSSMSSSVGLNAQNKGSSSWMPFSGTLPEFQRTSSAENSRRVGCFEANSRRRHSTETRCLSATALAFCRSLHVPRLTRLPSSESSRMPSRAGHDQELRVPSIHNWRTTDEDEINRRRLRAQTENFRISNLDGRHPIFSNFRVASPSGLNYAVEIRSIRQRQHACDCIDFRINGLGTCKHVEAVLLQLERRFKRRSATAASMDSDRLDLVLDTANASLRLVGKPSRLPKSLRPWFDAEGALRRGTPEEAAVAFAGWCGTDYPALRVSQEVKPCLETRGRTGRRDL